MLLASVGAAGAQTTVITREPVQSRTVRSDALIQIQKHTFSDKNDLNREAFVHDWQSVFIDFSNISIAEFQITEINVENGQPVEFGQTLLVIA